MVSSADVDSVMACSGPQTDGMPHEKTNAILLLRVIPSALLLVCTRVFYNCVSLHSVTDVLQCKPLHASARRPVKLHKWLLVGNELVDTKGQVVDRIDCSARWNPRDSKPCALLARATLDQGHSVLIFCCSKQASFWSQPMQITGWYCVMFVSCASFCRLPRIGFRKLAAQGK